MIELMIMIAGPSEKGCESAGFLTVLVPVKVTMYVSIVAFLGVFQLVATIPVLVAGTFWEKTSVEVLWVLMVTVTLSDVLYPLACMSTVCVL